MGTLVSQGPCPHCGSSDGYSIYHDEESDTYNATCFPCEAYDAIVDKETLQPLMLDNNKMSFKKEERLSVEDIQTFDMRGIKERKLTKASCSFYGMRVGYNTDFDKRDQIAYHYYPFTKEGKIVGYQERDVARKNFSAVGYGKSDIEFQGQHLFQKGGRSVIITEGFLDMVAIHQILVNKYGEDKAKSMAVISLPNGAGSAGKLTKNNYEYLTSFNKVVLMMDQDKPGKEAAELIAKILPAKKTYIASFSEKDACDMLIKGKHHELVDAFFNAESYTPAGIVTSSNTYDIVKNREHKECFEYPDCMKGVNEKTYGARLGEITLFTAGTGSGKTQFMRETIYHFLKTTDHKIGICSLEEGIADTVLGIMSISANKRLHLPDTKYTEEEYDNAWKDTMGNDRIMFLDHQGSVSDESLISKIEYMAATDHKFIFLDHITIAVSDSGNNVNAAIDQMMSDLLKLVKRNDVWIGVVSHLRKVDTGSKSFEEGAIPTEDDLKGSGALKQVPFDTIAFARNKYAKTSKVRNTTSAHVLKCRFTGRTGFANKAFFEESTGRMLYVAPEKDEDEDDEDFIIV